MILGHELAKNLALKIGDAAKFMGRPFFVAKVNPERGNKDDITVWINLSEAQELLGKKGLINGILALDCTCDTADRLSRIRPEIASILPDTQVIEYASQAIARAEARQRASVEAQSSLEREKESRSRLRREREAFAAVLVPVMLIGSCVWIGLLALGNVRDRRYEIGILRAFGLQSRQILVIFLGKAILIGLTGGLLGYLIGRSVGFLWSESPGEAALKIAFIEPDALLLALIIAPMLSAMASWLPALHAARQDPAIALREG
jgi:ABC-type lipoprotein release transport system permease subunit